MITQVSISTVNIDYTKSKPPKQNQCQRFAVSSERMFSDVVWLDSSPVSNWTGRQAGNDQAVSGERPAVASSHNTQREPFTTRNVIDTNECIKLYTTTGIRRSTRSLLTSHPRAAKLCIVQRQPQSRDGYTRLILTRITDLHCRSYNN